MTALRPGLADPVRDSQAVFRAVLDAMARPGRIHAVHAPAASPPPLDRATAALLLTLVDAETSLHLDEHAAAARDWVTFHTAAPAASRMSAAFAVSIGGASLAGLFAGTDEEPERSATLIVQVHALGEGERFRLDGPGLAAPATLAVTGLPPGFAAEWDGNRRLFPRGVDLILAAGDHLAALPRTVQVRPH